MSPASPQQPNPLPRSALSPCPIPLVLSNYFLSLLGLSPVAQHDTVASDPQLSGCVQLCHGPQLHVHDLGLGQGSFRRGPPPSHFRMGRRGWAGRGGGRRETQEWLRALSFLSPNSEAPHPGSAQPDPKKGDKARVDPSPVRHLSRTHKNR